MFNVPRSVFSLQVILLFACVSLLLCVLVLLTIPYHPASTAAAIECYQCNSTHERTCAEALPQHHSLYSFPCNHLQEPRYCVKMTGMFEGGSLSLGSSWRRTSCSFLWWLSTNIVSHVQRLFASDSARYQRRHGLSLFLSIPLK